MTDEALRRRDDVPKKLTATFEAGASISYSKAVGYTTTMALKEEISSTHCGYWTFIPRMIEYVSQSSMLNNPLSNHSFTDPAAPTLKPNLRPKHGACTTRTDVQHATRKNSKARRIGAIRPLIRLKTGRRMVLISS